MVLLKHKKRTRAQYDALSQQEKLNPDIEWTVVEPDETLSRYVGGKPLSGKDITNNYYTKEETDIKLEELENQIPPVVLGFTGESTAVNNELTRYTGLGSYEIDPVEVIEGDYHYYKWDDKRYPYNGFTEVIDEFGNEFIKVPKMYYKEVLTQDGDRDEAYISNVKLEGFITPDCFIDPDTGEELPYVLVGKYNGSNVDNKIVSKTGLAPQVSTQLVTSRTRAMANGDTYHLLDFHIKMILETLYLITFANTNPDTMFPQGSEGTIQNNGMLDAMNHHTGYTKGLDNYLMKFMGIENYFSNVYTQVDGIKIVDHEVFVAKDYRDYNSNENTINYESIANVPTANGHINKLGTMGIPKTTGATRYQNYYYQRGGYATLYFGRDWSVSSYHGLFFWLGHGSLDLVYSHLGVRLVKRPTK